ncbi:hypothetical protein B0H11DRAFT_2197389 [Mycena galericulata]|nr:hypothetical protein B0H11DRAFT_2197389 [Mycena galericulata]
MRDGVRSLSLLHTAEAWTGARVAKGWEAEEARGQRRPGKQRKGGSRHTAPALRLAQDVTFTRILARRRARAHGNDGPTGYESDVEHAKSWSAARPGDVHRTRDSCHSGSGVAHAARTRGGTRGVWDGGSAVTLFKYYYHRHL